MHALLAFLVALTLGAAAILLLVWWGHERIVWQPPRGPHEDAADRVGVRRVSYEAADGQMLFGHLVSPADAGSPPRDALLVFHGNAELAADEIPWARELARRTGWTLLLAEYRGYGGLSGRPTYEGSRRDAMAAHRWLRDTLALPPQRIGIFGYSLGSAVAAELAAALGDAERPAVLVLQAPFTSTHDMARRIAPRWVGAVWPWIGRVPFDTRRRVAETDVPTWVVHGAADRVVPVHMAREVHDAARRPAGLLVVAGADHVDLPIVGGARYWAFLSEALATRDASDAGAGAAPSPRRDTGP
jgi:fermentation-respiration switch protein FrsA (DUF1100 family)